MTMFKFLQLRFPQHQPAPVNKPKPQPKPQPKPVNTVNTEKQKQSQKLILTQHNHGKQEVNNFGFPSNFGQAGIDFPMYDINRYCRLLLPHLSFETHTYVQAAPILLPV